MAQRFLTNWSAIALKNQDGSDLYYLRSRSFIPKDICERDFENALFLIQLEGVNQDIKQNIDYEQKFLLKHKVSNRYLGCSEEFEEQANDTSYLLELSEKKCFFKVFPCFQYQTKISSKVKFNEDVFIGTQINRTKQGFVSAGESHSTIKTTAIGINLKSKFIFHSYDQLSRGEQNYVYGSIIWLSHIESSTILRAVHSEGKQQIVFGPIGMKERQQSIDGLWLIESNELGVGGRVSYEDSFRLQNLATRSYLSFSKNYKMVGNQRVYSMTLDQSAGEGCKFCFKSLRQQDNNITKGEYLIFQHVESRLYVGCRRKSDHSQEMNKPFITADFEDQDLYKLIELNDQEEETIRFIFGIEEQLRGIDAILSSNDPIPQDIEGVYSNMKKQVLRIKAEERLFRILQDESSVYIYRFAHQLHQFRTRRLKKMQNSTFLQQLQALAYQIISLLCEEHRQNQLRAFERVNIFLEDVFEQLGAEELLQCIFHTNDTLLVRVPEQRPEFNNSNLIRAIFDIVKRKRRDKNQEYWKSLSRIVSLLNSLIRNGDTQFDINQRIVSFQLFEKKDFQTLFFPIKITNQRIKVYLPERKMQVDIQDIRDKDIAQKVQEIFLLFSALCSNRNFISKKFVHGYLNDGKKSGTDILIAYLNIPLSKKLKGAFYDLITNLYVDSAPFIPTFRPLNIIHFAMEKKSETSRLEQDDAELSSRLKENLLLEFERQYRTLPMQINNRLLGNSVLEPSLTERELSLYQTELIEKLAERETSKELFNSIQIMLSLEIYSINEVIQIKQAIEEGIVESVYQGSSLALVLGILKEIDVCSAQLEIKKFTAHLKELFKSNRQITENQIAFLLPSSPSITNPLIYSQSHISNYNEQRRVLKTLSCSSRMIDKLLEEFIKSNEDENLFDIFEYIQNALTQKRVFLSRLMHSIIVSSDILHVFESLFQIIKKVRNLILISEYWLCSEGSHTEMELQRSYETMLGEITSSMFEIKGGVKSININRQLLVCNLQIHQAVLDLLNTNYYLLSDKKKSQLNKKHFGTFKASFSFLYIFILKCPQNKAIIRKKKSVLARYQGLTEVGQTKVFLELYDESNDDIKSQTSISFQEMMKNIIKGKNLSENEYNPEYLNLFNVLLKLNGKPYKPNFEKINKFFEVQSNIKEICFGEMDKGRFTMILNPLRIRMEPIQVPIIYHAKLLQMFTILIQQLESQSSNLRHFLLKNFSAEYWFEVLAAPDIFTHIGNVAALNTILKVAVAPLLLMYLDKSDQLVKLSETSMCFTFLDYIDKLFRQRLPNSESEVQCETVSLYSSYLREYQPVLLGYQKNERLFYRQNYKPVLIKLAKIFVRIHSKQFNPLYRRVTELLDEIIEDKLTQSDLSASIAYVSIDSLEIKWRNFVDNDEQNGQDEKYCKRSVLEILRNPKVQEILTQEDSQFFEWLKPSIFDFIQAVMKILQDNFMNQNKQHLTIDELEKVAQIFKFFLRALQHYGDEDLTTKTGVSSLYTFLREETDFQANLIDFLTQAHFQLTNSSCRKVFHLVLRLFNTLMLKDSELKVAKNMAKIFQNNMFSFRFFRFLSESLSLVFQQLPDGFLGEINAILSQMYLIVEEPKEDIYQQATLFLTLLCRSEFFTSFLRFQPQYASIDFLQKIFAGFQFLLFKGGRQQMMKNGSDNRSSCIRLDFQTIRLLEQMLLTMSALLTGGNESNQNYLIDGKYGESVVEVLKMVKLPQKEDKADQMLRNRLIQELIEFYLGNGIDLRSTLNHEILIIDCHQPYLLNRFKYCLLKLLLECVTANATTLNKVAVQMPIQVLKVGLIWVYEQFHVLNLPKKQQIILRKREDWNVVLGKEEPPFPLFLMIGFFLFVLIELIHSAREDDDDQDEAAVDDKEASKQKIVKKFFNVISERKQNPLDYMKLQGQPFQEELKSFYNKYYEALEYFSGETLTVEVQFGKKLTKVYFPRIPLSDNLTEFYMEKLKNQVKRVSQDEKIKSFLEFQSETYNYLQSEEEYFKGHEQRSPVIGPAARLIKYEDKIYLLAWFLSLVETILFLIEDFQVPSYNFADRFPSLSEEIIRILSTILISLNVLIGVILGGMLFTFRIPVLIDRIQKKREQERTVEEGQATETESSIIQNLENGAKIAYQVFTETFYQLFIIVMLLCTVIHPFFCGFVLLDIINRIQLGRQIIRSVQETWYSLLSITIVLAVFNYFYALYIYIYWTQYYGPACESLYQCLLLLFDQAFKSGSGFLGTVQTDYSSAVFNIKFFSETIYIVFAQKVVFDIFAGTIIDKLSQLRQMNDAVQQDQALKCFICGEERFQIDFELQGFEQHTKSNHCPQNYLAYMFYLRRKLPEDHLIIEKYVFSCMEKNNRDWIPDGTSLSRQSQQNKNKENQETDKDNQHDSHQEAFSENLKAIKGLRATSDQLLTMALSNERAIQ